MARRAKRKYAVVIERTRSGYSAYVPDLPGCVATGGTKALVRRRITEAVGMHLEGLAEDGLAAPRARAVTEYVTGRGATTQDRR